MNKASGINDIHNAPNTFDMNGAHDLSASPDNQQLPAELVRLFMQIAPQDVEQFYQSYHRWLLEQKIEIQQSQIAALQQKIAQNAALMDQVRPSALALSALAQLQASGVEDIELLDQMLERGEAWLDRTMQQLAYCERMDLIGESYTEWCRHALEGAYNWIDSLQEAATTEASQADAGAESVHPEAAEVTEDLLLQKLLHGDDTEKTSALRPRITSPLPALDEASAEPGDITADIADAPATEIVEPVAEIASEIEDAEAATDITDVVETVEPATEIAAEPIEATDSLAATAPDVITEVEPSDVTATEAVTEVEPVETTTLEPVEASSQEIEQESAEPVAQAEPEALEVSEPSISQIATEVAITEPEQVEQPDEIDELFELKELTTPEITEDDITSAAEIAAASTAADEIEEAEITESAEAEEVPQNEEVEAASVVAIEPATNEAGMPVDEMIEDSAPIAAEVVTSAEEVAPPTSAIEDVLTPVEPEEEQEIEEPSAPLEVELVRDEGATPSPAAEPSAQEEISSPSVETGTPPVSIEVAYPPQEQPRKPQPSKKPGFFRRLLAFLLS